jgi:Mn2+/Fe2+ NRAMP family transporter
MSVAESEQRILDREAAELAAIADRPLPSRLAAYTKRCGPGWLQGAITLGGGSLSGSLYLGIVMGYGMMWLQPLAMILGVVMLSAIAYVTLSTNERPMRAISQHVSPVLAWAWLIATLMANIVWCLPQFSLGTAAVQQNLMPTLLEGETGKVVICAALLVAAITVIWFYDQGGKGLKIFESVLKIMVGIVVISFFGVVLVMTLNGGLVWSEIASGMVPRFSSLFSPAPKFDAVLQNMSEQQEYWRHMIVSLQRDKLIAAFATAVGINMTFLLPYSMLKKGWGKHHRGLAIFDLATGLVIPYVLATGCVVIASASQFHGRYDDIISESGELVAEGKMANNFRSLLDARLQKTHPEFSSLDQQQVEALRDGLSLEEKRIAAMLVDRDAFELARSLQPLTGDFFAQKIFGIGVLGMALSTIIILMLISGFSFCEMFGVEPTGWPHRLGCLVAGIGVLGPFVWSGRAEFALAIPTSVFGGALLPIAYFTFLLLMNSRSLMKDQMPRGAKRVAINLVMIVATSVAAFTSAWGMWSKKMMINGDRWPVGQWAVFILIGLALLGTLSFVSKNSKHRLAS